jgi:hypothetical protein
MSQQEFKLVPVKATEEMLAAVARKGGMQARAFAYAAWDDLLANAPQPAPMVVALTDEQVAALRVAADALIEKYAEPIRALLRASETPA